jgi:hypothetical protein
MVRYFLPEITAGDRQPRGRVDATECPSVADRVSPGEKGRCLECATSFFIAKLLTTRMVRVSSVRGFFKFEVVGLENTGVNVRELFAVALRYLFGLDARLESRRVPWY